LKHNPGFLSDDQLVAQFVVRNHEFDRVIRVLRENTADSNQHVLVIGKRGMGKTMLVRRVAAELGRDRELGRDWYPVLFAEESYRVATVGELWLEALSRLAIEDSGDRWRSAHEELEHERDEERLRERALARLLDYADQQGKRLLLVVENLQDLLGKQMLDEEGWILRHTLQGERRIMLLATATSQFDDLEKPNKAAYELFDVVHVGALEEEECRRLWENVTGNELKGREIRPIQILTGGNPRLITILGTFAKDRSYRELMQDVLELIDDNSEYLKSNIEALGPTERRVFTALCDAWEPCLARDVAQQARIEVNTTSTSLGRLEERGAVDIVGREGRAKRYQVAERLYNIYYLLRCRGGGRGRAEGLVRFMTALYAGPRRLAEAAGWIAQEACGLPQAARGHHMQCLDEIARRNWSDHEFVELLLRKIPSELLLFEDFPTTICRLVPGISGARQNALEVTRELEAIVSFLADSEEEPPSRRLREYVTLNPNSIIGWAELSTKLVESGAPSEEVCSAVAQVQEMASSAIPLVACSAAARIYVADPEGSEELASSAADRHDDPGKVWELYGMLLPQDEAVLRRICERASSAISAASAWWTLGRFLARDPDRIDEAISAYRRSIESAANIASLGELGDLLAGKPERVEEARLMYDRVLELSPHHYIAMCRIGHILEGSGRDDDADVWFQGWLEQCPEDFEALFHRAQWLTKQREDSSALREALEILERASDIAADNPNQLRRLLPLLDGAGAEVATIKSIAQSLVGDPRSGEYATRTRSVARSLCGSRRPEVLRIAREHSQEAKRTSDEGWAISPDEIAIEIGLGQWEDAVDGMAELLADAEHARYHRAKLIELGIWIGARRPELLRQVLTPVARDVDLEPLLVALELDLVGESHAPAEVVEVARDVLDDIQKARAES